MSSRVRQRALWMARRPTPRYRCDNTATPQVCGNRQVSRVITISERGGAAMSDTYWTDLPSSEQAETAAASDSAASLAKGAMFTNDDLTDDPGVAETVMI